MSSTQRVISDSNKSPLVQVLTMMFLVVAILSCFVRMGTKIHMIKALRVDDILIIVATVSRLVLGSAFMAHFVFSRFSQLPSLRLCLSHATMALENTLTH